EALVVALQRQREIEREREFEVGAQREVCAGNVERFLERGLTLRELGRRALLLAERNAHFLLHALDVERLRGGFVLRIEQQNAQPEIARLVRKPAVRASLRQLGKETVVRRRDVAIEDGRKAALQRTHFLDVGRLVLRVLRPLPQ